MTRKQKTKIKLMGIPRKAKSVYHWLIVNIMMTLLCVAVGFVSLFSLLFFENPYKLTKSIISDIGEFPSFSELMGSFKDIDADIYFKHFSEDKE